jgi:5S rRNA maturation endonuclease (ribonuclease M5)
MRADQDRTREFATLAQYLEKYQILTSTVADFAGEVRSTSESSGVELVFPVYGASQELIGSIAFRSEEDGYHYLDGLREGSHLFNLGRAIAPNVVGAQTVIVVEDITSCLKVHQCGYRNVVALMGSTMSEIQEASLLGRVTQVCLMLDGDDEGWKSTCALVSRLATEFFVKATVLPSQKKPAELSAEAIKSILATY